MGASETQVMIARATAIAAAIVLFPSTVLASGHLPDGPLIVALFFAAVSPLLLSFLFGTWTAIAGIARRQRQLRRQLVSAICCGVSALVCFYFELDDAPAGFPILTCVFLVVASANLLMYLRVFD